MADPYTPEPDADAVSPALRIMLVEWRRTRIQEANSIARLIGLEVVMTTREHERRVTTRGQERGGGEGGEGGEGGA